jgi:Integrase core domain
MPGRLRRNPHGYIESFNARLRDELLNDEIFYTLREAQIVIESWRRHYNTTALATRLRRPRWRNGQS